MYTKQLNEKVLMTLGRSPDECKLKEWRSLLTNWLDLHTFERVKVYQNWAKGFRDVANADERTDGQWLIPTAHLFRLPASPSSSHFTPIIYRTPPLIVSHKLNTFTSLQIYSHLILCVSCSHPHTHTRSSWKHTNKLTTHRCADKK